MREVAVSKLGHDASNNAYVVLLQERDGERVVPIWIGRPEAEAIAAQLNDVKRARPMTHDLLASVLIAAGATLRRVNITKVEDNTFFAELHVMRHGAPVIVDARPSDAVALALRVNAPIYVAEALLGDDEEGQEFAPQPEADELTANELQRYLEQLRPEDLGKFSP
ncbi:MAG: bifunctional nuclease family protein [Gemmatimonadaceae bacterium]|nr:bifunctional nuclease family protein [Gemmatimonadaceae bacterium]